MSPPQWPTTITQELRQESHSGSILPVFPHPLLLISPRVVSISALKSLSNPSTFSTFTSSVPQTTYSSLLIGICPCFLHFPLLLEVIGIFFLTQISLFLSCLIPSVSLPLPRGEVQPAYFVSVSLKHPTPRPALKAQTTPDSFSVSRTEYRAPSSWMLFPLLRTPFPSLLPFIY